VKRSYPAFSSRGLFVPLNCCSDSLEKSPDGDFSDISFVAGRQRRGFGALRMSRGRVKRSYPAFSSRGFFVPLNCCSSVLPLSAVIEELPPLTTCVTASK